jgi:hypothetical protein
LDIVGMCHSSNSTSNSNLNASQPLAGNESAKKTAVATDLIIEERYEILCREGCEKRIMQTPAWLLRLRPAAEARPVHGGSGALRGAAAAE